MRLLYTPDADTLFEGVKKVLPGHMLTFANGRVAINQYYTIPEGGTDTKTSRVDFHTRIQTSLDRAVKRQLVADVPVGVYLSGGIDSTAVVDAVSRVHGNIDTFSIGFELEEHEESEKFNTDAILASKTAQHYGTKHHEYTLESRDIVSLIEESIWHMDEPVGNLTTLAQMKLAEYARKDVTVVLGGDGGDEIFGGYKRHGFARRLLPYWRLPGTLRTLAPNRLRKANLDSWTDRYLLFLAQKDTTLNTLLRETHVDITTPYFKEQYFKNTTSATFLDDMMRADLNSWLVDESLLRSDKMSMAHGLEQRVPLLDIDMVALARSIPASYKVTYFETKKIFKDSLKGRIPEYVFNQPKRGWIAPGAKWLRRPEVASYVKTVLSPAYYEPTSALFNWPLIERMYGEHTERRGYHLTPLWSVIVFQVWARRFGILVSE